MSVGDKMDLDCKDAKLLMIIYIMSRISAPHFLPRLIILVFDPYSYSLIPLKHDTLCDLSLFD